MFDLNLEIFRSKQLINWLVDGIKVHCIDSSLWKNITPEWVIENYNVDESYFRP